MHFKPPDQAGRPNFASDKTKRDGGRGKIDMHYNREAHGSKKGRGADKSGINHEAIKKAMPDTVKVVTPDSTSFALVEKAKEDRSEVADKQGDVVTLGDNPLYVERPLESHEVALPEYSAADVAPYRIIFGAVNQTVALHNFIDNILYLNQCPACILIPCLHNFNGLSCFIWAVIHQSPIPLSPVRPRLSFRLSGRR